MSVLGKLPCRNLSTAAPSARCGAFAASLQLVGAWSPAGALATQEHAARAVPMWCSVACRGFAAKAAKGGKSEPPDNASQNPRASREWSQRRGEETTPLGLEGLRQLRIRPQTRAGIRTPTMATTAMTARPARAPVARERGRELRPPLQQLQPSTPPQPRGASSSRRSRPKRSRRGGRHHTSHHVLAQPLL